MPSGSHLRFGLIAGAMLLGLPSCGLLPSSHYALTTLPLSPEQGWVQLPTARWLVNPGIEPEALLFCPATNCTQQAFVARMELTGREAGFAALLISDPPRALSAARPTHKGRSRQQPVSRAAVVPLALSGWSGGSFSIEARKGKSTGNGTRKAAHVAVVARRDGPRTWLMMVVAPTSDTVTHQLRLATE
ncbi:MAG: hypothetical protein ACRCUE_16570 [Bosea sp. (in: a-proteobacteria)]